VEVVVIAIVVVLGFGALFVIATARRRAATGRLTRETVQSDASRQGDTPAAGGVPARTDDLDEEARARAAEARSAATGVPARAGERGVAHYEPIDPEEIGVTRRQFFNRGILAGLGLGVTTFGVASLAFLWPSGTGGFGGKVDIGPLSDINDAIDSKKPFYNAGAKVYVVAYPKQDLSKAKRAYTGAANVPVVKGMEEGYVALYQRCVHLGCRVPFCDTSQWFECPCHGSKYNRVGEKRGGPAPRGLDRFPFEISAGNMIVDTGIIVQGPPIGTDTTGQSPEGPPCV
jgi:cytochrome b6-f complex iron-sulfur subunit